MSAIDFILSSLEMMSKAIPAAGLRYAYDSHTDFHIIEVYPESVRRGNEEYMEMECNLWKNFHDLYPQEDILISEVDDTNDMSNLIYEHIPGPIINEAYIWNAPISDNFIISGNIDSTDCDIYNFSFYNEAA